MLNISRFLQNSIFAFLVATAVCPMQAEEQQEPISSEIVQEQQKNKP